MTTSAPLPTQNTEQPAWTLASLIVGAAFFALWFWLFPQFLRFNVDLAGLRALRLIAVIPSVMGFSVALRCVYDFGHTGRGTPAPILPPQKLVVVGYYRYVRNPMYVGFFVGWIGLWIVFGHSNWAAIVTAAAVVLGVHLFVLLYEEPTLRAKFHGEYVEYCRNVSRWLPRLSAWTPGRG